MPMAAPSRAVMLGGVYVSQGRYDEAAPLFAANEAYFRDEAYPDTMTTCSAIALFHLGADRLGAGRRCARPHPAAGRRGALRSHPARQSMRSIRCAISGLIACAAGDLDEAATWFREELTRLRQRGSRAAIAVGLADVATLAAAREAWQPAVRLFAKAEALLQAEAAAFSLPARDHYERAHARARQALGDCCPGGGCRRPGAHAGAGPGGGRGGVGAGPRREWRRHVLGSSDQRRVAGRAAPSTLISRISRLPPSALPGPGIDADRHLVAVLAVLASGEVGAGVLARQLVDPGQGLEQLERDDLAPDLEVAVRAAPDPRSTWRRRGWRAGSGTWPFPA